MPILQTRCSSSVEGESGIFSSHPPLHPPGAPVHAPDCACFPVVCALSSVSWPSWRRRLVTCHCGWLLRTVCMCVRLHGQACHRWVLMRMMPQPAAPLPGFMLPPICAPALLRALFLQATWREEADMCCCSIHWRACHCCHCCHHHCCYFLPFVIFCYFVYAKISPSAACCLSTQAGLEVPV